MTAKKNYLQDFMNELKSDSVASIHVSLRCKIIKDNGDHTFNVQPLALYDNGIKRPPILYVPATYIPIKAKYHDNLESQSEGSFFYAEISLNYQVGDVVVVLFDDRDVTNLKGSATYSLQSSRTHDINDGVIIGKIYDGE